MIRESCGRNSGRAHYKLNRVEASNSVEWAKASATATTTRRAGTKRNEFAIAKMREGREREREGGGGIAGNATAQKGQPGLSDCECSVCERNRRARSVQQAGGRAGGRESASSLGRGVASTPVRHYSARPLGPLQAGENAHFRRGRILLC